MQSLLCFLQDFATPVVLNWESFCSLGDIWQCLQTFLVVIIGGSAIGIYWVEARDDAKHPTVHRIAPQQRELSGPKYQ